MRSPGGFADWPDEFETFINYIDLEDLQTKLGHLGIELNKIPADSPKPIKGQAYTSAEWERFKKPIKNYPDYEQPGHAIINEIPIYISVNDTNFSISIDKSNRKDNYDVTDDDFVLCNKLDKYLLALGWTEYVDRSVEKRDKCLSKKLIEEINNYA